MADEKKEEKKAETPPVKEAPASAPAAEAKPASPRRPTASCLAPAAPVQVKKEKPANCAGCNKSIRKKRWYYRNGKFYCTKRCWTNALKKEAKAPEEAGKEQK